MRESQSCFQDHLCLVWPSWSFSTRDRFEAGTSLSSLPLRWGDNLSCRSLLSGCGSLLLSRGSRLCSYPPWLEGSSLNWGGGGPPLGPLQWGELPPCGICCMWPGGGACCIWPEWGACCTWLGGGACCMWPGGGPWPLPSYGLPGGRLWDGYPSLRGGPPNCCPPRPPGGGKWGGWCWLGGGWSGEGPGRFILGSAGLEAGCLGPCGCWPGPEVNEKQVLHLKHSTLVYSYFSQHYSIHGLWHFQDD